MDLLTMFDTKFLVGLSLVTKYIFTIQPSLFAFLIRRAYMFFLVRSHC
jgi:hypothetical protein